MTLPVLSRDQVREVDRRTIEEFGMTGLVLMENAGRGCTDQLCRLGVAGPVVICCGRGNNAGDGFVIARHLDIRSRDAKVLVWGDPGDLRGDAAENYRILTNTDVPIVAMPAEHDADLLASELAGADWIVDALLGTGARGEPRPPLDAVIDQLNEHPANKLAVDLPSGLDCDTGQAAQHTFRADHTCTFVAVKPGFLTDGAEQYTGVVYVHDIGAPRQLVEQVLAQNA